MINNNSNIKLCQAARSDEISQLMSSSQNELSEAQEELLQSVGCQCSSTRLNLTTTDQNIRQKSEAVQLGQYQFQVSVHCTREILGPSGRVINFEPFIGI